MTATATRLDLSTDGLYTLEAGHVGVRHYDVEGDDALFLFMEVEQRGIDVTVTLFGPKDNEIFAADSPIGDRGEEMLIAVLEQAGRYRVEIQGGTDATGDVIVRSQPLRLATDDDRLYETSDRAHRAGWRLHKAERGKQQMNRDFGATLEAYRRALDGWEALALPHRQAETLASMAKVYEKTRDYDRAMAHFDRAIALLTAGHTPRERFVLSESLDIAGTIRRRRFAQPRRAIEDYFRPALDIVKDLDRPQHLGATYHHLGRARKDTGALQEALDDFDHALDHSTEPMLRFNVLVDQASTLLALYALDEALATAERALVEAASLTPLERARATRHMADALARLGRLHEAQERAEQAMLILRRETPARLFTILITLGDVLRRQEQFAKARGVFEEAVELARTHGNASREALATLELANVVRIEERPAEALELCDRALYLAQETGDERRVAAAHARAAEALRDLHELERAAERMDEALDRVDTMRASTVRQDVRSKYFAFRQEYYDIALGIAIDHWRKDKSATRAEAALLLHDRRLARELRDAMLARQDGEIEARSSQAERTLEQELSQVLMRRGDGTPEQQAEVDSILLRLQDLRGDHRRAAPPTTVSTQRSVADVAATLGPDTQLVVFALGPIESYRWTLDDRGLDSLDLTILPEGRDALEVKARQWRSALTSPRGFKRAQAPAYGERLARALAFPSDVTPPGRLVIVADGALAELPFLALPMTAPNDPERTAEIVLVPSLEALLSLRARSDRRPPTVRPALVVSDPVYDLDDDRLRGRTRGLSTTSAGGQSDPDLTRALMRLDQANLPRLPATAREAEALLGHMPVAGSAHLSGLDADREAFETQLRSGVSILHLATHAIADVERPDLSGIVLSLRNANGSEIDGFIRASELVAMGINADLVVLSGCNTATGQVVRGEGMVGLARRVLDAGATRVIASLWPVSDGPTADLMSVFYDALWQQGLPPAQALRAAQASVARDKADPHFWAGFVFLGDWRRPAGW